MDERMMNMFSLIANQVQTRQELFEEEGKLMQALLNGGFRLGEANAALTLMQTLVQRQADGVFPSPASAPVSMRSMNREERDRFNVDAFGFTTKLAHLGIITEEQREDLFEQAMACCTGRIELDDIKSLVTFTLFVHPRDHEIEIPTVSRRVRRTSWN